MEERPLKVLLVEDDEDDAFLLETMLAKTKPPSLTLVRATKVAQAQELLAQEAFDAALLDLSLPDSDGLETFTSVHAVAPNLPIVVLTGLDDETLAIRAVQEGAQDYLVKGQVNASLLLRSLRYAIERQRTSYYRALLAERERCFTAVSEMSDGLVVCGREWDIEHANRSACLLLNLGDDAGRGRFLGDVLAPFALSVPWDELQSGSEPSVAFEIARTGTVPPLYLDARLSRSFDATGSLSSVVLLVRDITDERLARNIQANFFTAVSHKLRTPLAILFGYVQLCKVLPADKMAREWGHILAVCEAELRELSEMVRDLLDFRALSTWQLPATARRTNVAAVINSVAEEVRERYPDRCLELTTQVAPDAAEAEWSEEHLGFVLEKLLDNAVKFADKEPVRVRVVVQRDPDGALVFSVEDNGPGIPHEYFDRIFEGFVQVEERVTGQVPGLGLGLCMARQVIEACGGSISVTSTLGQGSIFTFVLPAATAAGA